jgi:hypothetical protein
MSEKKCIACGESSTQLIDFGFGGLMLCQACDDHGKQMENFIKDGIELKYSDGTKEIIKEEIKS